MFFRLYSYSADYDYKSTIHTLTFEPSNERGSQQQCVEIEIINDSLPEDWEVFTLQLSTNNSAVDLTTHGVDVYIQPNNGLSVHCILLHTCVLLSVSVFGRLLFIVIRQ